MAEKIALEWKKLVPKSDKDKRNSYQKDYDKIVFSQCFRRLAGKTQVHPFAQSDHVHTRLSHSMEVSIVGRSIMQKIFEMNFIDHPYKKEQFENDCINIVMAAGLAHDMGNPPFGHVGEDAIASWVKRNTDELKKCEINAEYIKSYSSYDGNAQNFHIFQTLEYFGEKNLSSSTLASFVKYPWVCDEMKKKGGCFKNEEETFKSIFEKLGLKHESGFSRHPLSYIMEAADDICYGIMDVDDAYEMGIVGDTAEIAANIKELKAVAKVGKQKEFSKNNPLEFIRKERGLLIESAVDAVAKAFKDKYSYVMSGNVATKKYKDNVGLFKDLIAMNEGNPVLKLISNMKKYARDNVFIDRNKVKAESACYNIINTILDNWLFAFKDFAEAKKYDDISNQSKKIFQLMNMNDRVEKKEKGLVQVIDFVSGMTDRYAKEMANVFSGNI
ncbi:dGTP triphosphohydrolase [Fibrobacter sp.]|uniref:dGTP triphosphohydrolase n=1 Tax=Fibrobacter sp. TaxID=35828 RepID=UPI003867931B